MSSMSRLSPVWPGEIGIPHRQRFVSVEYRQLVHQSFFLEGIRLLPRLCLEAFQKCCSLLRQRSATREPSISIYPLCLAQPAGFENVLHTFSNAFQERQIQGLYRTSEMKEVLLPLTCRFRYCLFLELSGFVCLSSIVSDVFFSFFAAVVSFTCAFKLFFFLKSSSPM